METTVGEAPGWQWARGSVRGVVRNVVDSFPVFGLVTAYQGFGGVERSVTRLAVRACEVEAGRSASPEALTSAIEAITAESNRALAPEDRDSLAVGAVVTLVVVGDSGVVVRHIGEAGVFLRSGGEISLLTQQHSLVGQLLAEGRLTLDEATTHPQRNIVIRSIGDEAGDWDRGTVALEHGDQLVIATNLLTWALRTPGRVDVDDLGETPSQCVKSLLELDAAEPGPRGATAIVISRLDP